MLNRRSIAIVGCIVSAALAGCSKPVELHDRAVATRVLAEYLLDVAKPESVLVVSNPFARMSGRPPEVYAFEKAAIEGLREGFNDKASLKIEFPQLEAKAVAEPQLFVPPGSKTPVTFLLAPGSFDRLVSENKDCDLVISLIGLPVDPASVSAWTEPGGPAFAFLLPDWTLLGTPGDIRSAFASRKLLAAVVEKPGAPDRTELASDYNKAFNEKFILVTAKNVDELLSRRPEIFRP